MVSNDLYGKRIYTEIHGEYTEVHRAFLKKTKKISCILSTCHRTSLNFLREPMCLLCEPMCY